jgi:hypothetical protein
MNARLVRGADFAHLGSIGSNPGNDAARVSAEAWTSLGGGLANDAARVSAEAWQLSAGRLERDPMRGIAAAGAPQNYASNSGRCRVNSPF